MNTTAFSLQSQRIFFPDGIRPGCLTIIGGTLAEIHTHGGGDAGLPMEDMGDLLVMPGLIDPHVHINEPGRTHWEGFETATAAARSGGVTTLVEMPLNASPVTTSLAALKEKVLASRQKLAVTTLFYGGVVPGNESDLEPMLDAGVPGLKAFMTYSGIEDFPASGSKELRNALQILKKYNRPLLVHAELDFPHPEDHLLSLHPSSYQAYLASRPRAWEDQAIAQLIDLCRETQSWVHIVHLSSASALPMIRAARAEGLPLTLETAQHYLVFEAEQIPDGKTAFKCAPPIREKANNDLLWEALLAGDIDFVATDHSPAPPEMKALASGSFKEAWGGIAGIQFALPALWTGMKQRNIPLDYLLKWGCEGPAKFIQAGHRLGKIAPGYQADLVAWRPEEEVFFTEADVLHRHKLSPYTHTPWFGKVYKVWNQVKPGYPKLQKT
jgi:allantoinase